MAHNELIPEPVVRNLRIYAFDPSVAGQSDLAGIAEITIPVPWESKLKIGPVGEYIEVVDADPASGAFYLPVNLNDPRLLAQNGLAPSDRNPQFHQQMVYAVAMATIDHFERALGRVALWSSRHWSKESPEQFVRRLRIYPHALRERNAYYSPEKKALLFGYFPVNILDANNAPGTLVFSCLSHDIIAHETTHALLDGVHPRYNEPTNVDMLAFHEGFADIVALFQHFAYPGILQDQISRTRGNLADDNLLGELAQQFGKATGRGEALRNYLGGVNPETGKWEPVKPDVRKLSKTKEPHERGAVLVAAVFGAFMKMYRLRSADLYRIATDGTGVLKAGDIHPDLANRLAGEARRAAEYTLQMCIRALDYCPPVDLTFGTFLSAVVTADVDYNAEDELYRVAFVESCMEWGIHPEGRNSTSVDGLLWAAADETFSEEQGLACDAAVRALFESREDKREWKATVRRARADLSEGGRDANAVLDGFTWGLESDRKKVWEAMDKQAVVIWKWLVEGPGRQFAADFNLVLEDKDLPPTILRSKARPMEAAVEIHAVRTALRRTPRGGTATDLVVEVTQRRVGFFDEQEQTTADKGRTPVNYDRNDPNTFIYRAGCTLLIDRLNRKLRRVIKTPGLVTDIARLDRVRRFLLNGDDPPNAFNSRQQALKAASAEPFAMLHQSLDD